MPAKTPAQLPQPEDDLVAADHVGSSLTRARTALEAHRWQEAADLLRRADAETPLGPDDLDALGQAGWWIGDLELAINARERAFAGYLAAGREDQAAGCALSLAGHHGFRQQSAMAAGWITRAEQLLTGRPETAAHGHLERNRMNAALHHGDLDTALAHAERVQAIGRAIGDRDVEVLGLHDRGRVLIGLGRVDEGMAALSEAVVAAIGDEMSPYPTAVVYCNATIAAEDLTDYHRAAEFSDAAERWCARQSINGFPGMCRVRRVEIQRLRGAWDEAERQAVQACDELRSFSFEYAGEGYYQIGEIKLRRGDLAGADAAFREADQLGREPLPGLALLHLAQGREASAAALLARALADPSQTPLARARLLPAEVEVALAIGDLPRADSAVDELEQVATQFGTHYLRATAAHARGRVAAASEQSEAAVRSLKAAIRLWREVDAPYETARTRVLLGDAYRAAQEWGAAATEYQAAAAVLEKLGAVPEAARATALHAAATGAGDSASTDENRVRRTFMFTDIVGSTALIEAIGDGAWSRLLAWHDRTIRRLFGEHGGEEVHKAGDGFFAAFTDPRQALDCAVAIQRNLAEQRKRHGFAPSVRIGLHSDTAQRTSAGYEGRGVHIAARVGALADGDSVLASRPVFESIPGARPAGPFRRERLRGVGQEVEVAEVSIPSRPMPHQ